MKRIILITVITLSVIISLAACINQKTYTTEVIVMRDITDKHLAQPDSDQIFTLFGLNQKWNGAVFFFSDLSDVGYNKVKGAKLEPRNEWLSNEMEREKEIVKFKDEISHIIKNAEKDSVGKTNTSVYFPVIKELTRLSRSNSSKRIMLIYSDLLENTEQMSFYDKQKIELLKTNPDSITKYFQSMYPLPRLDGIEIYLIYQPVDIREDEQYRLLSGYYKKLFESSGAAKVDVVANLN